MTAQIAPAAMIPPSATGMLALMPWADVAGYKTHNANERRARPEAVRHPAADKGKDDQRADAGKEDRDHSDQNRSATGLTCCAEHDDRMLNAGHEGSASLGNRSSGATTPPSRSLSGDARALSPRRLALTTLLRRLLVYKAAASSKKRNNKLNHDIENCATLLRLDFAVTPRQLARHYGECEYARGEGMHVGDAGWPGQRCVSGRR